MEKGKAKGSETVARMTEDQKGRNCSKPILGPDKGNHSKRWKHRGMCISWGPRSGRSRARWRWTKDSGLAQGGVLGYPYVGTHKTRVQEWKVY